MSGPGPGRVPDGHGCEGQGARLRGCRRLGAAERLGESVAEIEVGFQFLATGKRRNRARAGRPRSARTHPPASEARARLGQRTGGGAQELDAEPQIVDVRPLVGRVDQARGQLDVHRPQREEAVRDGAERLAKPVRVGEAGAAQWRQLRARLVSLDPIRDRLQSGVSSAERVPPKRSIVSSSYSPSPRIWRMIGSTSSGVCPGRRRRSTIELARARDHVSALGGLDHRRREGEGEQRLDRLDCELVDAARRQSTSAGAGCSPSTASRKPATSGPIVGSGR